MRPASFQSTLPVGGATGARPPSFWPMIFQSTLPVGGATQMQSFSEYSWIISIHAPRGGSDRTAPRKAARPGYFNPRSPWGERRRLSHRRGRARQFQSTLPVGGATNAVRDREGRTTNFNPRSPWGERLFRHLHVRNYKKFQSTLPVGGATKARLSREKLLSISIHAPRGGSDSWWKSLSYSGRNFNPRSPWGERLGLTHSNTRTADFNPRSPWGERLGWFTELSPADEISIHAPRGGSDLSPHPDNIQGIYISIHAPRGGSDLG